MKPWWIKFEDREPGCLLTEWSADADRALLLAGEATGSVPVSAKGLPYAARPLIGKLRDETWCHSPEKCAGYSSCRNRYACSN